MVAGVSQGGWWGERGEGYRERVGRPEDRRYAIAADRTMRDNDGREVWRDTRAIWPAMTEEVPTGRDLRRRREMSLRLGPSIAFRVRKPTESDRVAIRRSGALRIRDIRPPPPAPPPLVIVILRRFSSCASRARQRILRPTRSSGSRAVARPAITPVHAYIRTYYYSLNAPTPPICMRPVVAVAVVDAAVAHL